MTLKQVREKVIDSLRQLLDSLEKEVPKINDKTKPIGDLGLESDDGIDWICDLEEMGFNIPKDVNLFVVDKGNCVRTVGEIVELLHSLQVDNQEESTDE